MRKKDGGRKRENEIRGKERNGKSQPNVLCYSEKQKTVVCIFIKTLKKQGLLLLRDKKKKKNMLS